MSVYTQLTNEQFSEFCNKFGVSFKKATPITKVSKILTGLLKQQTTRTAIRHLCLPYLKNENLTKSKKWH